ncbi:hypothetical protein MC885_007791 [Smutsia gigantea]|nr:hypothetical protein MC885_007791 [Smutsia gigantea]
MITPSGSPALLTGLLFPGPGGRTPRSLEISSPLPWGDRCSCVGPRAGLQPCRAPEVWRQGVGDYSPAPLRPGARAGAAAANLEEVPPPPRPAWRPHFPYLRMQRQLWAPARRRQKPNLRVPVRSEGLAPEHGRELLRDALEQLLDGRAVANEGGGHLEPTGRDVAHGRLHVVGDPLHEVAAALALHAQHLLVHLLHGHAASEHCSHRQGSTTVSDTLGEGTTLNVFMILSGNSSRILLMSSVPIPDPVPPPSEWVSWKPCRQSQLSASFRTTSRTASTSSAPSV